VLGSVRSSHSCCSSGLLVLLLLLAAAVDTTQGSHESRAATALALVAVGVTVRLVIADKVRRIRELYDNLKYLEISQRGHPSKTT